VCIRGGRALTHGPDDCGVEDARRRIGIAQVQAQVQAQTEVFRHRLGVREGREHVQKHVDPSVLILGQVTEYILCVFNYLIFMFAYRGVLLFSFSGVRVLGLRDKQMGLA